MELFILWIVCGIAAAAVASSKNRSGAGWFFLGMLLGPFALLMVGFMPKLEPEVVRVDTRKCPFCAEFIKPEAKVCKHCGRDLPTAPDRPNNDAEPIARSKFVTIRGEEWGECPGCHKMCVPDATECGTCGQRFA
jgi:hypothetical protein